MLLHFDEITKTDVIPAFYTINLLAYLSYYPSLPPALLIHSIFNLLILTCFHREGGITNDAFTGDVSPDVVVEPRHQLVTQQSSVWTRRQQAVCVRHAYKNYGPKKNPNHVLQDLNMTVAKGTM
jgi:hypothetical protein